jgi:hypothetical protein
MGCNPEDVIRKTSSAEDQAFVEKTLDQLRKRQFDEIEKRMDSSVQESNVRDTLAQMSALLPSEDPSKISLIAVQTNRSSHHATSNLVYEYSYQKQRFIVDVVLNKFSGTTSILGFHIKLLSADIEEQSKFKLVGKSAVQYLIFVLAIVFPIVTIVALIICIRMKLRGRKWPWVLFILFGFCNLAVNWNTGEIGFSIFALQLLSASANSTFYGPWIISVSLPLGAICFLIFRKNHAAEAIEASTSVSESN